MVSALPTDDKSITRLVAWMVLLPLLAFWPFLSAMPAFTLLAAGASPLGITLNIVLFATGFWGVFGLFMLAKIARPVDALPLAAASKDSRILVIGSYALVWYFFFTIVVYASR